MKSVLTLPLHRPVILHMDDTLKQAAYAMSTNNIGSVLVVDRGQALQGIITDRDLAMALALGEVSIHDPLSRIIQGTLVTVPPTATVDDVIQTMREYGIRRLPVVKEDPGGRERCLGVISLDDLIKFGLIETEDTREIVSQQLNVPPPPDESRSPTKYLFKEKDRRRHTYYTFINRIAEATHLSRGEARNLTLYILSAFLRRITVNEGKDLLAQLPYLLQAELMSDISNADRSFKTEDIIRHISERFNKSEEETKELMRRFWRLMRELISPEEVEEVCNQMPQDMQSILR